MRRERTLDALESRRLKLALSRRDGAWCCFCGDSLPLREATLEHVIPFAHGGSDGAENLRLSCLRCNRERGVRPFWEYAALAARRPRPRRRWAADWVREWRARPFSNPRVLPTRLSALGRALVAAGLVPGTRPL
ncbi:MAG TPA: HNH endonuclease [Myxococcales bacterium]|nr:HNH endonuclease [Myxococcales bacterium]